MKGKRFWQFKAAAEQNVGELMLYGIISAETWWGDEVTPKQFKTELDALGEIGQLNVYINSDGGDVFAGQAIHSMLKRHKATVHVYVDGIAASIASVIAMAGDKVIMPRNAMMMIHKPWTWGAGNANDLRKMADELDRVEESIISAYEDKTGMKREEIATLLDAETWMTAEEAVAKGFADQIEETKQVAARLRDGQLVVNGQAVDLSRYRNPPKLAFIPTDEASGNEPEPPPDPHQTTPEPIQNQPDTTPEPLTNMVSNERQPQIVAPLSVFARQLWINERGM